MGRSPECNRCKWIYASLLLELLSLIRRNAAFFSRARWFDLLMGTDSVRKAILKGESEEAIRNSWQKELQDYKEIRKKYLLYE